MDFAKQTGDYAVLSHPDLHVLALTYALEIEAHGTWRIRESVGGKTGQQLHEEKRLQEKATKKPAAVENPGTISEAGKPVLPTKCPVVPGADTPVSESADSGSSSKPLNLQHGSATSTPAHATQRSDMQSDKKPLHHHNDGFTTVTSRSHKEQDSDEDDLNNNDHDDDDDDDNDNDENNGGEWITPENILHHKNKALGIVTEESSIDTLSAASSSTATKSRRRRRGRKGGAPARMSVACMTGDFAVQNVLLQMGLYLVSVDGARIERVKSWVLRCHACYRICKDPERKFCPSCGNATLIRTSVTTGGGSDAGMQVHLKPNFQYRNRGTIYSLPMPKPGSASGGRPSGQSQNAKTGVPILREDQLEWQRAVSQQKAQRDREERALQRALEKGHDSLTARYADPDWIPDLLTGAHTQSKGELPALGIGRKNPNERRRRRR